MRRFLFSAAALIVFFSSTAIAQWKNTDLVISEVMFYSPSGNNEFIEIYNKSETTPINLFGYKFKYYTSGTDSIMSAGKGTTLQPKSYAVVFEGDYSFYSGLYNSTIPSGALQLIIDDNSFGSNGMSNTTNRPIVLLSNYNDTVDVCTYSADNSLGFSDEKLLLNKDTSSANWGNSIRYLGTPGFRNSIVPYRNDLYLSSVKIFPATPLEYSTANINIITKNPGLNDAGSFSVNVYKDAELLNSFYYSGLKHNDSVVSDYQFTVNAAGNYTLKVNVMYDADEDTTNNSSLVNFTAAPHSINENKIVINEIMYAPSSGQPEWIELFNRSDENINLKNWRISDNSSYSNLTLDDLDLAPGKYIILCKDTSFKNIYSDNIKVLYMSLPQLNNTGDKIVLRDSLLFLVDSLDYFSSWGGSSGGYSLERIDASGSSVDSSNWAGCRSGNKSTPGFINSVSYDYKKMYDAAVITLITEPRYPSSGDSVLIKGIIKNLGSSSADNISAYFFYRSDGTDYSLGTIENISIISGDTDTVSSPIRIPNLTKGVTAGLIIYFTGDEDTLNNQALLVAAPGSAEGTVIINEIMYDPNTNEPEWVEIYNHSSSTVNLNGWKISDIINPDSSVISSSDLILEPEDYLVIEDEHFGALSNTGDGVVIYDSRGAVIDSVYYQASWGSKKGFSIERISPTLSSSDSTNWSLSVSKNGSTAGDRNSVCNLIPSKRNSVVINEIMYDPADDNCEFIEFYNSSPSDIDIAGWTVTDKNNSTNRICESSYMLKKSDYFIAAADSLFPTHYGYTKENIYLLNISDLGLTTDGIIVLKDAFGNVIDSVHYSDKWHNKTQNITKDKSLERINPFSNSNDALGWSTSVELSGATPGEPNSIFTENKSASSELSITPNPFSPDNDGYEDVAFINYRFGFPVSSLVFRVFDSKGRLVKTISDVNISSSEGSILFNGNGDDNSALRMGIYILIAEGNNYFTGENKTLKTTFVVARKL